MSETWPLPNHLTQCSPHMHSHTGLPRGLSSIQGIFGLRTQGYLGPPHPGTEREHLISHLCPPLGEWESQVHF